MQCWQNGFHLHTIKKLNQAWNAQFIIFVFSHFDCFPACL